MKKTIRVTAKKVEDAISQGLEILGVTIAEAEIAVISTGGLFKKAEVEISIGTDDVPAVSKPEVFEKTQEKPAVKVTAASAAKQPEQKQAEQKQPERAPKPQQKQPEQKQPERAPKPQQKQPEQKQPERAPDAGKPVPAERKLFGRPVQERPVQEKQPQDKRPEKNRREPRPSAPATPALQAKAEAFLNQTLNLAGISASVKSDTSDGLSMTIDTEDSIVIGHRGETLDALQYLTSLVVNGGLDKCVTVSLDALGYRVRRAESLQRLAQKMAEKCIAQNRRVSLESMNNSDRKEIHAYLAGNEQVVTRSEGNEPNRRVVIYPSSK